MKVLTPSIMVCVLSNKAPMVDAVLAIASTLAATAAPVSMLITIALPPLPDFWISVCFNTHIVTQKNTQYKAHHRTFFVPEYRQKQIKHAIICTYRKNFMKK